MLAFCLGLASVGCGRDSGDRDASPEDRSSDNAPVTFQGNPQETTSFDAAPNQVPADLLLAGATMAPDFEAREFVELSAEQKAALQQLIEEFRGNPTRRGEILEQIESNYYSAELLPLVREILGMGEESLAIQALEILGGNTSPDIMPVLDQALGSPSEDLRLTAVHAASQIRDDSFITFLGKTFEDSSEAVRLTGLDILEHQTKQTRFQVYDRAMDASHSDVNLAAILALEIESNIASIDILIKGLESPDPDVRLEAETSLEFQLDHDFDSAAQAREWWAANRNRYDEDLFPKDS